MNLIDPDTYIFQFGKYKGASFNLILKEDPSYICWCIDNIPGFDLDEDTIEQVENEAYLAAPF